MDIEAISSAVALMAATGAVSGLGEGAALDTVNRIRERIRLKFGGDPRSVEALEGAVADPSRVQELASALAWYAQQDPAFRTELTGWAEQLAPHVTQNVRAGRDAYTAAGDMTVHQRPDTGDART